MNGCLFKALLIMTAAVGLFLGYPYLKQYASESMQGKISNMEMQGEIVKKFAKQIISGKIAEQQQEQQENQQKNDNTKNQETGK